LSGPNQVCGRVLVVDDDAGVRSLIAAALARVGFEPLEAADGEIALELAVGVDAAVVEVELPVVCGYEVCHRIKSGPRPIPVVFLSGARTEAYDRVGGLLIGGDDYVVKPFAPDELVARIRGAIARAAPAPAFRSLTKRELQVLALLTDGLVQREIAELLVISPKTVGTHIEHILEKLGAHSRAQAVALAYAESRRLA
jgi:DNA-binding NarL/FixJ family response regulator